MQYRNATTRARLGIVMLVVLVFTISGTVNAVVVDNVDAGFSVTSGTWNTSSASGQYGDNYRSKSTSTSVTGEVEWRPTLPEAGTYQVSVWYPSTGGTRPNNAHYAVHHNGGVADVYISQQANGSQWVSLGTYDFDAGTSGYVRMTDQAQKNKTIAADAVQFLVQGPPGPEFRGFWADVFHEGFLTAAQVDAMVAHAIQGNYNAILPEVLAYHDTSTASHGAYWRSNIVPQSSRVTADFDPLGYLIQQAHAAGIEVHPWLVAFRVSSAWPPPGNSYLAARPEWLMVPSASIGSIAPVGSYYTLDPGNPEVQEYLVNIVQELVTDYEVDGIHWDYIRYTQPDAGYPTNTSYTKSTLARFKEITGYAGTPAYTYDPWEDFRRRTITELVRRVRGEIPLITSNPRQPVRYSAALVTWYPANSNFHLTRPYYDTYCDWEDWIQRGYLDASIPMAYFDEDGSYAQTYRDWVDNSVIWAANRHNYIGPGIYMNSFANSVTQLEYARNAGADGICTYSYGSTNDTGTTWTDWYPYVAANSFTQPATIPEMPWRDPATATEGTLFGRITAADTGQPLDDATVQVGASSVQTDGNGYYIATMLAATAGGTAYNVTASHGDYPDVTQSQATVIAGDVAILDLEIGAGPDITQQPTDQNVCSAATANFTVQATGTGTLSYQWRRNGVDLVNDGRITGATTSALSISDVVAGDVGSYDCVVSDDEGSRTSSTATLTLLPDTQITQNPLFLMVSPGSTANFDVTATGSGVLTYQWQFEDNDLADGGDISGAQSSSLQIANVAGEDLGAYRCVVTGDCGIVISSQALLSFFGISGDFDDDDDVDSEDFGHIQQCLTGIGVPQEARNCLDARLDGDGDVDEADMVIFMGCLSGPNMPVDPSCVNP